MNNLTKFFTLLFSAVSCSVYSQIVTTNQIVIKIDGVTFHCNGGMAILNNSQLFNDGEITTTINSTLLSPGDFILKDNSTASGDGKYNVEQNWINDGNFIADNSTVHFYGNKEQIITSTIGQQTTFHNLTLSGNGTGADRKKSLVGVSASADATGMVDIKNRELSTNTNNFTITNTAINAIVNDVTFHNEGFVSSQIPGNLIRYTNQISNYIFPVGSSDGITRYRPVSINPNTITSESFEVRMYNQSPNVISYSINQHEEKIDEVNNLFVHSIKQTSNGGNSNFSIYYIPSEDGEWSHLGQWNIGNIKWYQIDQSVKSGSSDFEVLSASNFELKSDNHWYGLVKNGSSIHIPNVFTPNGDGVNDFFTIDAVGLTTFELTIVNRWGEMVFFTDNPNISWDGKIKGNPCADGVYFYSLKATLGGENIEKHGHITIN